MALPRSAVQFPGVGRRNAVPMPIVLLSHARIEPVPILNAGDTILLNVASGCLPHDGSKRGKHLAPKTNHSAADMEFSVCDQPRDTVLSDVHGPSPEPVFSDVPTDVNVPIPEPVFTDVPTVDIRQQASGGFPVSAISDIMQAALQDYIGKCS